MRFNNLFSLVSRCKMCIKPLVNSLRYHHFKFSDYKCSFNQTKFLSISGPPNNRIHQDEGESEDEADPNYDYMTLTMDEGYARDLLYKNSKDLLLQRIYCCVSVQELFNVLDTNVSYYKCEHVTQTILTLYDLMKIYRDVTTANMKNSRQSSKEFLEKLQESNSFQNLLKIIEDKINYFDVNTLSYSLLYLNKLGLTVETNSIQLMSERLKKKLLKNFSISAASRFLEVAFSEVNLRSYFMSQELIPLVLKEIDSCISADNLDHLSASLNKLHKVVTEENLEKYKQKVENFIKIGLIKSSDYKAVLQIIAFLNYPKWREQNSVLISKCILLIRNNLNELNMSDILLLYEIFFKVQEPGAILNDMQRCSSKYFHQLDDAPTTQKITLFSTIIYFASPNVKNEYQKVLKKYVKECNDYNNLILLRKLLSYTKLSDMTLCDVYWDKVLDFIKNDTEKTIDLIKLSQYYINFSNYIDSYRHLKFESVVLKFFDMLSKDASCNVFPQKLASILNFVLIYGDDLELLEYLLTKLETNWEQLKYIDCVKLAYTLKIFNGVTKKYNKLPYAHRINKVVDKIINRDATNVSHDLWKNSALLKSCIYKNKADTGLLDKLLTNYKNFNYITSKNIENMYYCFLMTNTLIPEVIDNMLDYIITYKDHVLGFNISRVLYLCFCLGYHPKKIDEICGNAFNIIIRDQERMTGLSMIYCALALSFFNKLPNSIIKSIFNVEFMDKLDHELQICYSRDKYPQRVRNNLMQLNRAVCLDYPECNVPWFHQKYVDEVIKAKNRKPTIFSTKVKEHLKRIVNDSSALSESVITPYGYDIDFVLNLNHQDEVVEDESRCTKKLALVLIPEYAYTRMSTQLKGAFQMKKRHLEILGYKVILIKFRDWIELFYPEDRTDFLRRLIWPKKFFDPLKPLFPYLSSESPIHITVLR